MSPSTESQDLIRVGRIGVLARAHTEALIPLMRIRPTSRDTAKALLRGSKSDGSETQTEAAGALGVSARTLQRDLAQFMEEVGVRSRFELGAWWARNRVPSASADTACDDTVTREGTR